MRLLVHDACFEASSEASQRALRSTWAAGARIYETLGHVDAAHGATSWDDALAWLTTFRGDEPIAEIQFWGHGRWGHVLIGGDVLDAASLGRAGAHGADLEALGRRMLPDASSLVWLRTCETFGAHRGHDFATRLSERLGARVAGHTHVIGALQSGLHGLRPGTRPHWSPDEGIRDGTAERPRVARGSSLSAPNTTHFLRSRVPEAWFDP